MNNIIPFSFESAQVRVVTNEQGNPLFVAKDILLALGYVDVSNIPKSLSHVPEEWKGRDPIPTPGGTQQMVVLSEQGLYFFVARSDKPKALPFQKWLAGEVLPQIRKTGSYHTQAALEEELRLRVFEEVRRINRREAADEWNKMEAIICAGLTDEKQKRVTRMGEAQMLNDIVLGMSAKHFRHYFKVQPQDAIRDNMHPLQTKAISALESANVTLIRAGLSKYARYALLEQIFLADFPQVALYRDDTTRFMQKRFDEGLFELFPTHPMQSPILNAQGYASLHLTETSARH